VRPARRVGRYAVPAPRPASRGRAVGGDRRQNPVAGRGSLGECTPGPFAWLGVRGGGRGAREPPRWRRSAAWAARRSGSRGGQRGVGGGRSRDEGKRRPGYSTDRDGESTSSRLAATAQLRFFHHQRSPNLQLRVVRHSGVTLRRSPNHGHSIPSLGAALGAGAAADGLVGGSC
jgi:hypothetical protein